MPDGRRSSAFAVHIIGPAWLTSHVGYSSMNLRGLASIMAVLSLLSGCSLLPPKSYTHGASSHCDVHGVEMHRTVVPIYYGLPAVPLDQEYVRALDEAKKSAFPHAQEFVEGGCIVKFGVPRRATLYVCPCCRSARRDWMEHHHPQSTPNQPAAGRAGIAFCFESGHHCPGLPEPIR
jgi:hypothetical protein